MLNLWQRMHPCYMLQLTARKASRTHSPKLHPMAYKNLRFRRAYPFIPHTMLSAVHRQDNNCGNRYSFNCIPALKSAKICCSSSVCCPVKEGGKWNFIVLSPPLLQFEIPGQNRARVFLHRRCKKMHSVPDETDRYSSSQKRKT